MLTSPDCAVLIRRDDATLTVGCPVILSDRFSGSDVYSVMTHSYLCTDKHLIQGYTGGRCWLCGNFVVDSLWYSIVSLVIRNSGNHNCMACVGELLL